MNKKIAATQKELNKNDAIIAEALNSTSAINCETTCTNTIPPTEMNSNMCDHCHIFVCAGAVCLKKLQEENIPTCPVAKLKERKAKAEEPDEVGCAWI